jgi:acetyl-CoA carboxylase biotin carboxylase subunit
MRTVEGVDQFNAAFEAAQREAFSAFGDRTLYLERALKRPRHIEVQILGDMQGSVVHLGERECSIQRRHQKLVEEAPAIALSTAERESIGQTAVQAATAIGYTGAGTVEFLYEDGNYYFLEMNTRIQVEHPVTELVTGLDLVDWQIRIASGEALNFTQEDVRISGHAIECRITAENPQMGLLPSTGTVTRLEVPTGAGVRWDGGIREGSYISEHYDPLLGKLIVRASTRAAAIQRMARALDELLVLGVENCASFQRRVMDEPDFVEGRLSIRYLEEHPELLNEAPVDPEVIRSIAIAGALLEAKEDQRTRLSRTTPRMSRWQSEGILREPPRG